MPSILLVDSEGLKTETKTGKMSLHMLGTIAEFERDNIVDNVKMGTKQRLRKDTPYFLRSCVIVKRSKRVREIRFIF
ncbi:recombinase family protein [Brevibacillus fluminis]|uniref:recombinase family protein n=1 Tax=Brevibacillus fluminis TaxID=511487 RepID=UPI0024822836|nr:recombinase family protein [Brevibacillus fluminis]